MVTVAGESERVAVTCHWAGGVRTAHALTRPVKRLVQLSTYPALIERIGGLHAAGLRAPAIAETLNREGWRPPSDAKRSPPPWCAGCSGVKVCRPRPGTHRPAWSSGNRPRS